MLQLILVIYQPHEYNLGILFKDGNNIDFQMYI